MIFSEDLASLVDARLQSMVQRYPNETAWETVKRLLNSVSAMGDIPILKMAYDRIAVNFKAAMTKVCEK